MRVAPTTNCHVTADRTMPGDGPGFRSLNSNRVGSAWQVPDGWINDDDDVVVGDRPRRRTDVRTVPSRLRVGGQTDADDDRDQSVTTMTKVRPSTTTRSPCQCLSSNRQVNPPVLSQASQALCRYQLL